VVTAHWSAVDPSSVVARLRPLLLAVHSALTSGVRVSAEIHRDHGWNPSADRHLDHQLVRREAMERLKPWGAGPDELSDPLLARQLVLADGTDNLGLAMSGLILRTPADVLRVWRSDDGELPAPATDGLRAFYRQAPSRQLQLDLGTTPGERTRPQHLALLWADSGGALDRFDLVRPSGYAGRRVQVDWHVDLHPLLPLRAA
jgi:hypothetical protein